MNSLTTQWGESDNMDDWGSDEWESWEDRSLAHEVRDRLGRDQSGDDEIDGDPAADDWRDFDE